MYCRSGSSAASSATSRKNSPTPVGGPSRYANTASALQSRIRGMSIIGDAGNDYLAVRSFRRKPAQNLPPFSSGHSADDLQHSRPPIAAERVYHGGIHPAHPPN